MKKRIDSMDKKFFTLNDADSSSLNQIPRERLTAWIQKVAHEDFWEETNPSGEPDEQRHIQGKKKKLRKVE